MKTVFSICLLFISAVGFAQPGNGCDPGHGGCIGRSWSISSATSSVSRLTTVTYTLTPSGSCAPNNAPVITISNPTPGSFKVKYFNGTLVNVTIGANGSATFNPVPVDYCNYSQGPNIVYTVMYDVGSGSTVIVNTITSVTSPNTIGTPDHKSQTGPF